MRIKHKVRLLLFLTAYLIMAAVVSVAWVPEEPDTFTIKYDLTDDHCDTFQVFYSNGYVWNETASVSADYYNMGNRESFSFNIPFNMTDIRIDLGNIPGKVEITNIRFALFNKEYPVDTDKLLSGEGNNIPQYSTESESIIVSADNDSYFSYNLSEERDMFQDAIRARNLIFKCSLLVLIAIIMVLIYRCCDSAVSIIKSLIKNCKLVINLAMSDFKAKYAGNQLGIVWAFVQPAVTALIYIFVFQVIGRAVPIANNYPYSLWLLPGIVPWFYFSESVFSSTNSLADYSYLVKKIMFNIEILPVVKIISAFFIHIFLTLFVIVIYLVAGVPLNITMLQIVYYMICNTALSIAVGYFTCSLLPFLKDMSQIVNLVLMVAMWACPIMWDLNIISDELDIIRKIVVLNPMYYIVNGFRESYMGEAWFIEHPMQTLYFWGVVLCLFVFSTKVFKKLQPHFSDVL